MASLTYDLTLAGLSVGSAAALTGIGLVVTHRATGVLNFAHGAVAMVCAYLLRQLTVEWDWPLALAAPLTLLVVAPAIGVALERFVFRPLSVLGGDPAQTLVASIGVFVLLVGGAALVWGPGARPDAPVLVAADPWGQLAVVLVLAAGVGAVIRWTRFGRELRAVVDDRSLAALGGVDADRVAAAGWAFGSFTAGLTGVLLAPYVRLDPYGMPLLVMEVVTVAVTARMRSLPVAVVVALGIGIAQSQLTRLHPAGRLEPLLQAVGANLFVVALLVAALVLPGIGTRDALPRTATARVATPPGAWIVAVVLFLLPLGFAGSDLHTSVQVPALGVVLLSLVVVTGRGGQISLGQAAYAGLGALFTALLAAGRFPGLPELPELAALLVAVGLVAPLGLLTGWPAIRRHGLALALATFAVGVGVSRFVLTQPYATSGLTLGRPAGFEGDRAYYVLELALLAGALLAAHALRRGRTGRALAALRDHEAGASAAGVRVPALKLTAFVAGAALAALGGGMLGMGLRAFDPAAYDPVRGLLWFAAIVVLGADSVLGALLAAALLVGLDAGTRGGVAAASIGLLAILVGRFPGGPYEALRRATEHLRPRSEARLTPLGTEVGRKLRATLRDSGTPRARAATVGTTATGATAGAESSPGPDTGRLLSGVRPLVRRPTPPPASDPAGSDTAGSGTDRSGPPWTPGPPAHTGSGRSTAPGPPPPMPGGHPPVRGPTPPPSPDPDGPGTDRSGPPWTPGPPAHTGSGRSTAPGPPPPMPGGHPPVRGPTPPPSSHADGPGTDRSGPPWTPGPPAHTGSGRSTAPGPPPPMPGGRGAEGRTAPAAEAPGPGAGGSADAVAGGGAGAGDPVAPPARAGTFPTGLAGFPAPAERAPHSPGPPTPRPRPLAPRAAPGRPVLRARALRVAYAGFTALDGVDLDLPPGRITAVVGPNGAGKSTLFHCLAGTVRPVSGRVALGERDITRLPAHARTRLGIARTFQQLAVFPTLTVAENVRVGAEQGHVVDPDAAERALRLLGLDGAVRALPAAGLPTGTLRRVELARALAGSPRVLLLDEPAAGLDTGEVTALARVLRALAADGKALLVVEHDLDLVAGLADTVHVMTAGHVVASGPADHVLEGLDQFDQPDETDDTDDTDDPEAPDAPATGRGHDGLGPVVDG
ncbi:ABC-type branched-subunit amino acid transport system ATPase component/branched-subunit amino acid ABC-type transport system permease component [Streptomyces aurantiacus]|uniref:branched-chain amino acid ABC transporter permease/ATP-binding protein n=1 Tax=Streptomyces aurantiacus TaxID=47760 RepID=UPI002790A8B5|nr:branched-chain amino acid ABC transporter permease/ATP-binding protein [Streptomyces aurantiacus]MDQ0778234.1 ABC-type branched-subunit amino acid transport system ATPase component/branched-subunit amino acid ABC-type transport system permease component [Streptomyces aurantiacus]